MAAAAILNFRKYELLTFENEEGLDWMLRQKFYENHTNGSGDIQIYMILKMTAGGHLELSKMSIFHIGEFMALQMGTVAKIC